jgi:hypothetical protein
LEPSRRPVEFPGKITELLEIVGKLLSALDAARREISERARRGAARNF